jgi:hypothetical protein
VSRHDVPRALLASVLLAAACSPVPPPPADLLQVVDVDGFSARRDEAAARELMAAGDLAWEDRDDPEQLAAAFRDYGRAAVADPDLYDAYWKAARAASLLGRRTDRGSERAAIFERGSGIARLGMAREPDRPEARYYFATTLGLWARERRSIGLASVKEMVPLLERVAAEDPALEEGGACRALSLLYLRAPEWPTSIGDVDLGLEWAERAVDEGPEHPGNFLALAEAQEAVGDDPAARDALDRAAALAASERWSPREREAFLAEVEELRAKLR